MESFKEILDRIAVRYRTPLPKSSICAILTPPGTVVDALEDARSLGAAESPNVVWVPFGHNPDDPEFVTARGGAATAIADAIGGASLTTFEHNDTAYLIYTGAISDGRTWQEIVDEQVQIALSDMRVRERPPAAPLSIAPMNAEALWKGEVDIPLFSDFLVDAGEAFLRAGIPDVQMWLQLRTRKGRKEKVAIYGVIIDIDKVVEDVLEAIRAAGVPMPTAFWKTLHGLKLAYVFDRELKEEEARAVANWLVVAFDGGDPASADPAQGQHLPVVLKSTEDGDVEVPFEPVQGNPVPHRFEDFPLSVLPRTLTRFLGGRPTLTGDERAIVESYLSSMNLAPPDEPGDHRLYAACPECEVHDTKKCYVNRALDGSLSVRCFGGHEGHGPRRWSEHALLTLARGTTPETSHGFDPITDIQATWGGREYRRFCFQKGFADAEFAPLLVDLAEEVWVEAWARVENDRLHGEALLHAQHTLGVDLETASHPGIAALKRLYRARLGTYLGVASIRLLFDEQNCDLQILQKSGRCSRILTKSSTLSLKNHSHEWRGTTAFRAVPETVEIEVRDAAGNLHTVKDVTYTLDFDPRFSSHFNKALVGNDSVISALGIPRITSYVFPIAFVSPGWGMDPVTKTITGIRIPCPVKGNPDFDVVGFFMDLFRRGCLPLATDQDVLRLLMAISSPLLRGLAPGLLGIYWLMGPPGSGKDFLADVILAIWVAAIDHFHPESGFDLSMTDDLEMKRSFYAAHPAVFARAKEAGKRKNMVERLIQFAGTRAVPARGMYRNEVLIPNDFTFIADSAEDLPERKEISRRTVVISVSEMDDTISKGAVLQKIVEKAPDIVAALQKLVESKPKEWYLGQTDTHSRPIVPVALAKLLGVALAEVEGRDLSDLFEAMYHYVFEDTYWDAEKKQSHSYAVQEAERQMSTAREKDGNEAKKVRNYSYAAFADALSRHDKFGFKALFKEFPTNRSLFNALLRETEYQRVDRKELPYLPVQIGNTMYAFKLLKSRRNFILMEEYAYCATAETDRIPDAVRATIKGVLPLRSSQPEPLAPPVKADPEPSSDPSDYTFDARDDGQEVG